MNVSYFFTRIKSQCINFQAVFFHAFFSFRFGMCLFGFELLVCFFFSYGIEFVHIFIPLSVFGHKSDLEESQQAKSDDRKWEEKRKFGAKNYPVIMNCVSWDMGAGPIDKKISPISMYIERVREWVYWLAHSFWLSFISISYIGILWQTLDTLCLQTLG